MDRIRENAIEDKRFSAKFSELLRGRIEDTELGIRPGMDRELTKDIVFLIDGRNGSARVPMGKDVIARTLRAYDGDSADWFAGRRGDQ